jgi:proteasome-interacting protein CIC1
MAKKAVKNISKKTSTKPKGKVVKAAVVESVAGVPAKKVSKSSTTPSLVPTATISKALNELKAYVKRSKDVEVAKSQLFEDELISDVQIQFTRSSLWTSKKDLKPRVIPLTQKISATPSIALIVRDGSIDKELLEKIEASELNNVVSQIITGQELKTTYKPFEKRRQLWSQYDLFLADDAVVTTLPKLLGKTFYESRKVPVPISVGKNGFKVEKVLKEIEKITTGVVYRIPRSDNLVVNLGSLDNITDGTITEVINHFAEAPLRGVFIKTSASPALPLYEAEKAFTEETAVEEKIEKTKNVLDIAGEQVKLSTFERALVELAQDDEVPKLLASKIKKAKKATKIAAKKATKEIKPNTENNKVKKISKQVKKSKK